MKEIRIFIASSQELLPERNYLSYLTLAHEEEFEKRNFRVRLSKWEYIDPKMTAGRTEDRYLDEMLKCDAVMVLFRNVLGKYTKEEMMEAIAAEQAGTARLKAHELLFAADGAPDSDAAGYRSSLTAGTYRTWSSREELRDRFLDFIGRVAQFENLFDAPGNMRKITAFLAADEELAAERDAFADTVLNVNELLAHRNLRIAARFYDPKHPEGVLDSSEMGLVIYGTNCRVFGMEEIEQIRERLKEGGRNPKRFYVFFRNLDETAGKALDEAFRTFRDDLVSKLDQFPCQFGDANTLRLSCQLLLERYTGESVKEFYSTVTAPTAPIFAGREKELRKLCGLLEPVPGKFPFGRLPVITGAGGTGKSELARQFAWQLRVQYPGGVFQVDMEHIKTWDDLFLGLLNGIPNNGIQVKDYLDIKTGERGGGSSNLTGADVRDALLAKARKSGPVLLVLDNVESCLPLLGRDGGFAKAFPSGLSERVRVDVVATARVCGVMLRETDWAVEFPLGDLSPEAALELLLADRPEADAAERKAAGRVAELLGYRALYLRRVPALIGDLYAQTVCDSFAELADTLEENLLGTVAEETEETHLPEVLWKMTRERLLKMPLGAECVKLAEVAAFFPPEGFPRHILEHLWKTVVAPGQDERKFARAFEIVRHHNLFQSADPVRIHRLDRAAILHELGGENSEVLDSVGRSLAECAAVSPGLWLSLAEQFPRMIRWVPGGIVDGNVRVNGILDGINFQAALLIANPAFADNCSWEKLDGGDWAALLQIRPQFAERCPWEKLDHWDWSELLQKQPQFADRCPPERLLGEEWSELLQSQPQFADKCLWEKLNGKDWAFLLRKQPQFAGGCPWEKLNGKDWCWLLCGQPQFADKCRWEILNGENWASLLLWQPRFADKCPWEKLGGRDWAILLQRPEFAGRCRWEKLSGSNWEILIEQQPRFAERCPWEKLGIFDWTRLFEKHPQFADRCPWDTLSGEEWSILLQKHPRFADRCPWETLEGGDWASLLEEQPQFADKCPWEMLDDWWAFLLCRQPQFADRCPWEVLNGEDWARLLQQQPQFANKCPWEKLDGEDWANLLGEQPQFADKCPLEKLSGRNWAELVQGDPQFAAKCPWEKLEGSDWAWLLWWNPQFADNCQWEKFDGRNWVDLLGEQPQFADKCDWRKLSEDDWRSLLEKQPQFADRRPQRN